MRNTLLTIITIMIAIALFLGYALAQKAIKDQAIDGCLRAGTATFTNSDGLEMSVPEQYWYDFCLNEKGVKINKNKTENNK